MMLRQFFYKFNFSILLVSASLQVIADSEVPVKEVLIQKDFKSINVIHHSVPVDIECAGASPTFLFAGPATS